MEDKIDDGTLASIFKEAGTIVYLLLEMSNLYGVDLELVLKEIIKSESSKVWADGVIRYDLNGEILYPPHYHKVNIDTILHEQVINPQPIFHRLDIKENDDV